MTSSYADPRLTACYDVINPPTPGDEFYLALVGDPLAGDTPRTVLDMGCGTGRLARAFAARGHRVTGADPSSAMLSVARGHASSVTWIESDGATLALPTRFDLIIMTGHVFQVLLDDDIILATLRNLREHLAPSGCVAFETRNPAVAEWRDWVPEKTRETFQVPGIGTVENHNDIATVAGDRVTYETHYRFGPGDSPGDVVIARDTIRFMGQDTLAALLRAAGYSELTWYGDWDRSPISATSPEIIVVTR